MISSSPVLENAILRVEKIGWDDSFQMRQTLDMLRQRELGWEKGIYIFSAFKDSVSKENPWNSTDFLIGIANDIASWNKKALADATTLESLYTVTLTRELSGNPEKDSVLLANIAAFEELQEVIKHGQDTEQKPREENDYSIEYNGKAISLMWWWEMLVSRLYSIAMGQWLGWVDTYAQNPGTKIEDLRKEMSQKAMTTLGSESTAFVPWYSGNLDGWVYKRVWRWYSDWTAAMMYSGIRKNFIDTDVAFMIRKLYGLSSADPRTIENVQIFTHMSYELLLQMIDPDGADAGFVNRAAAMPSIFRNWGQMKVYTDAWEETLITMDGPENPPEWIQFVQNRRTQRIRIHSYNMDRNWYFAFVTDFLSRKGYSIIDDSSDATSINLMIAVKKKWKEQSNEEYRASEKNEYDLLCGDLQKELKEWEADEESEVDVSHESKVLIFTGGENIDKPGVLSEITRILAGAQINLWPVVQTDKPKVIVFWVDESQWVEAVKVLHNQLVEKKK
jgi:aspartokinase